MVHPLDFPGPDNTTNPLPIRERLSSQSLTPEQPVRGIIIGLALVFGSGAIITGLVWLCSQIR